MATLPIIGVTDQSVALLQNQWSGILNPVIANALVNGIQLTGQKLVVGSTTFSHNLNRLQLGMIIVDQNAAASIFRSKPYNSTTLTLTSNAVVTVNLWVY